MRTVDMTGLDGDSESINDKNQLTTREWKKKMFSRATLEAQAAAGNRGIWLQAETTADNWLLISIKSKKFIDSEKDREIGKHGAILSLRSGTTWVRDAQAGLRGEKTG